MPDLDPIAIAAGTVVAFIIGAVYYGALSEQMTAARATTGGAPVDEQPDPRRMAAELLRCLVLATVVAGLASQGGVDTAGGGLLLGGALWLGFPLVLWTGAMLWEATPWRFAALHAGAWLLKLLALGLVTALLA